MRISPTEVRQQQFEIKFRGYNVEEVNNYIEVIAQELEELNQVNSELREELEKSKVELTDYKKNDLSFRKMIGAAQEFKDDVTGRASKEAELILKEAETKSYDMIRKSEEKVFNIEKGISDIKMQREQFELSLRNLIANHLKVIDSYKNLES